MLFFLSKCEKKMGSRGVTRIFGGEAPKFWLKGKALTEKKASEKVRAVLCVSEIQRKQPHKAVLLTIIFVSIKQLSQNHTSVSRK